MGSYNSILGGPLPLGVEPEWNWIKDQIADIQRQVHQPSPLLEAALAANNKEKKMKDTTTLVADEREARLTERVKEKFAEITSSVESMGEYDPGSIITASAKFTDEGRTYHYAWVKGEGSKWFRTRSMDDYPIDSVVDELVRLAVDAVEFEYIV